MVRDDMWNNRGRLDLICGGKDRGWNGDLKGLEVLRRKELVGELDTLASGRVDWNIGRYC